MSYQDLVFLYITSDMCDRLGVIYGEAMFTTKLTDDEMNKMLE